MGIFAGVRADRVDRRVFMAAGILVLLGLGILALALNLGWGGASALGALYGGALFVLVGIGCLIAYAAAAMRLRLGRRPFDGCR